MTKHHISRGTITNSPPCRLLGQLSPAEVSQQIPGWSSQGSVYLQYISLEAAVSAVLEAGRAGDTLDTLHYQLEKLRPAVSRLCRAVASIPVTTAKERLAQSEIAKKVRSAREIFLCKL